MFIKLSKISKTFKLEPLFEDVSLTFGHKDKVGIVGRNGTGKTTLLKIIAGEDVEPDSGIIEVESSYKPFYFSQQVEIVDEELSVTDYLFKLNGLLDLRLRFNALESGESSDYNILSEYEENGCYEFENSISKILSDLKLEYINPGSLIQNLSGGERTRLRMSPLLFEKFEILLLDEPTNNLDLDSIQWLENFVKNFEGVVLIVSHDRKFLDNVANRILEIEDCKVVEYSGNYSEYKLQKESNLRNLEKKTEAQKKHVSKIQTQINSKLSSADYLDKTFGSDNPYIMSKSGKKAKQALILKRRLEREIEESNISLPKKQWSMDFEFQPTIQSSNNVVELVNVSKSFGKKSLFKGFDLKVNRGNRVLITGKNGSGKTTLLKIIAEAFNSEDSSVETQNLASLQGQIIKGEDVIIGYFNQEDTFKACENSVIDEFMNYWEGSVGDARTFLHKMLFKADDVFMKVSSLSPGERAKFKLATILAKSPNLLILDEPTNNLDIASREQLEKALKAYTGTLIVVSHDRYFVEQLEFEKIIAL